MARAAKALGLKARIVQVPPGRLARAPLPALAELKSGGVALLGKFTEGKLLLQDPASGRPMVQDIAEFSADWTGRLLLAARRPGMGDLGRAFGLGWFMGAVHKYRHILAEVLVASFFLQVLGLVSALFFQVVVDKRLTEN